MVVFVNKNRFSSNSWWCWEVRLLNVFVSLSACPLDYLDNLLVITSKPFVPWLILYFFYIYQICNVINNILWRQQLGILTSIAVNIIMCSEVSKSLVFLIELQNRMRILFINSNYLLLCSTICSTKKKYRKKNKIKPLKPLSLSYVYANF